MDDQTVYVQKTIDKVKFAETCKMKKVFLNKTDRLNI